MPVRRRTSFGLDRYGDDGTSIGGFGLDLLAQPRTRARELPLLPVYVRVFVPEPDESDRSDVAAAAAENFDAARAFWRAWASIDLRLMKGGVELIRDNEDRTLSRPSTARSVLDDLTRSIQRRTSSVVETEAGPHQAWLSVVYVEQYGDGTYNAKGKTFFRDPEARKFGYGVVLTVQQSTVLAHELGHALGLSHTPMNSEQDGTAMNQRMSTVTLHPFPNDIVGLKEEDELANLMLNSYGGGEVPLSERWLSESQAHRARLTVLSRRCPYSTLYMQNDSGRVFDSRQPLIADITGAFVAESFPIEARFRYLPPK